MALAGVTISGNSASGQGGGIDNKRGGLIITASTISGNSGDGVLIEESSNTSIGGTAVGAGNVISGNSGCGVHISGPGASGNQVQGNFIGTDATGETYNLATHLMAVWIDNAPNNSIGGTAVGAGNVISA